MCTGYSSYWLLLSMKGLNTIIGNGLILKTPHHMHCFEVSHFIYYMSCGQKRFPNRVLRNVNVRWTHRRTDRQTRSPFD